jgi:hypothetical protein
VLNLGKFWAILDHPVIDEQMGPTNPFGVRKFDLHLHTPDHCGGADDFISHEDEDPPQGSTWLDHYHFLEYRSWQILIVTRTGNRPLEANREVPGLKNVWGKVWPLFRASIPRHISVKFSVAGSWDEENPLRNQECPTEWHRQTQRAARIIGHETVKTRHF